MRKVMVAFGSRASAFSFSPFGRGVCIKFHHVVSTNLRVGKSDEFDTPIEVLEAGIVHCCRDFTGAVKQIIQKSNAPLSFNPGYGLDEIAYSDLKHILRHTMILFINEHEEEYIARLFGLDASDIRDLGPDIVVTTLGSRGCRVITESHDAHVPAVAAKMVDPTGAGDSFAAGFLFGYQWSGSGMVFLLPHL
ncbi:hypothetical protein E2N92_01595 [Methanofollis formosanus]|uniref:Carbohydrate kinase PfkB domain-containing protein n=1 Tax=Methanofollis formosanus TaxID=299308 RepID=A0A8G0ZWZ0_9EURY|nr:PfkB family carbohydrate kinase [Methanofollis formosanus]QYZ78214.1 hypothetical protein E2N92_01595 [Methanofollis formosanus]